MKKRSGLFAPGAKLVVREGNKTYTERVSVFSIKDEILMTEWGLNTCNHLYQVTDGNYTVAWLVADENDGAGYYEDDEDDQVLVNLFAHFTFLTLIN